ncbi:hypothetical protein SAMN05443633_104327 [Chryseobacterium arachidis]|uniref:Uncharacterized protein n=1 Tax=Chryseobacterium arachidis TaxID=1416778 RepID=A0A1M5BX04_9FLAO|nr:hypothetical protein [Chryseobacterium arachidis]SHF47143.1 hypothetical protein SAMN05443633_104327 [Chryseobacterium arachidis]
MSIFYETLILLKEKKDPKSFILNFNENLKSINVLLEKSDSEVMVFNDDRNEEEKEPIWLDTSMTDEEVVDLVCSWKGLGLLTYRHQDFQYDLGINYLTWNDKYLSGFVVSYAHKDTLFEDDRHKKLISKISEFIDYEYVIGNISIDSKIYIRMEDSLEKIKEHILKNSFEIDSRTW